MSAPSTITNSAFSHHGAGRSGKPSRTVWIASAWISAPAIVESPEVAVRWKSCSDVAVDPTTTIFPRTADLGNDPS